METNHLDWILGGYYIGQTHLLQAYSVFVILMSCHMLP